MTIWITTNGRPSDGAAALAAQPGFARARKGGKIKPTDLLINWGSSKPIELKKIAGRCLNHAPHVGVAANKLSAFKELAIHGVTDVVDWTTDKKHAEQLLNDGCTIVARTTLTGHSGDGIIVVEKGEEVPDAPLYTTYVFKTKEFRVHVVGQTVVDTQRKIRDPEREPLTWKVRSHANGFIFARNNVDPCAARDLLATSAIAALGLDFGAVDIVQDKKGKYYVLEINTAPGLEGQTIQSYAEAFRGFE